MTPDEGQAPARNHDDEQHATSAPSLPRPRRRLHHLLRRPLSLLNVAVLVVTALGGWMSLTTGLIVNKASALLIILNGLTLLRREPAAARADSRLSPSGGGPHPRRPALRVSLVVVGLLLVAACTAQPRPPGEPAAQSPSAPQTVDLGDLGRLPPVPKSPAAGPKLTTVAGTVDIPGRHELGSVVVFRLPVRNDGDEPLVVERVEPG